MTRLIRRRRLWWLWLLLLPVAAAAQPQPQASIVGGTHVYTIVHGDTLTAIAAKHGVSAASIAARNALAPRAVLEPGRTLIIDNLHLAIRRGTPLTINIAQRLLIFAGDDGIAAYPITVGRSDWPTPVGAFTIIVKEKDPTWDVPISIQREMAGQGKPVVTSVAPSPENPLGTRWLGLSLPGLGIHGTNAPSSIYRYASHGCIRMHPDHIVELFERVEVGTAGVLTYEPVLFAVIDGRVWLEVNPDPYRRVANSVARVRALAAAEGATEMTDWAAVEAALRRREGRAIDVTHDPRPFTP
jgi:L,D-transpeptidase ErfK/SrfK